MTCSPIRCPGSCSSLKAPGCSWPITPAILGCRESSSVPITWESPGSKRPAGRSGCCATTNCPGPERLAGLAAQFQEVSGVPCQFTVSGQAYELPSEARLAVYRVAQEALTNITKHACPERVEVHLGYEPRGTRLTVENFAMNWEPPRVASDGSGYGLTGMRERAELLGGELTTAMTRGGFRVELRVPA